MKVASMTEMATTQGFEAGTAAASAEVGDGGGLPAPATRATGGSTIVATQVSPATFQTRLEDGCEAVPPVTNCARKECPPARRGMGAGC